MTDVTKTINTQTPPIKAPKQPQITARAWCWTLNNYTDEEVAEIKQHALDHVRYLIFGYEVGESGTPHLQGYLECSCPKRMSAIKKIPGMSRAHLGIRHDTREHARRYCMKGEQPKDEYEALHETGPNYGLNAKIIELGKWTDGGQGSRTDWHQLHAFLKENPDFSKAREEYPEECIKYTNGIRTVINDIKREQNIAAMDAEFEGVPLYRWQAQIIRDIQYNPDKRKIIWVVDPQGNRGKTWFAKYLLRFHGSAYLQNGKSADLAHAYNGERVVTFDFCRSNEQATNYQIIEQIKNGMVFSPKYDSMTKINAIPHVICFSNFEPNRSMLSQDRWDIRMLTDESCTIEPSNGAGNTGTAPFDNINIEMTEDELNEAVDHICNAPEPIRAEAAEERLEALGQAYFGDRWESLRDVVDVDEYEQLEEYGRRFFGERWAGLRELIDLEVHLTGDRIDRMIDQAIETGECELIDDEEELIWLGNI